MATEKNFKVKKGLDVSSGSVNVTNTPSTQQADLLIFNNGTSEVGRIRYTADDNLSIYSSAADHAGINLGQSAITPLSAGGEINNAIDLGSADYKFRKLFLGTEIDAGNFKYYNAKVNINTQTNTKPLEISRLGDQGSQVMKIGVGDREADFVYIEDTQGEGKNNFGQYRFFLGGNHTNTDNEEGYVPEDADIVALRIEKDNLSVPGDITVAGDINVAGSLNTTSTTNLTVEDKTITLNQSASDSSGTADGAGVIIQDAVGASTDASILWDQNASAFDFTHKISAPELITDRATIGGVKIYDETVGNNYISFAGTTGDNQTPHSLTYIGERIYSGSEQSELLLFKGNDTNNGSSGPDRIRHFAAEHAFDVYSAATSGGFAAVGSSSNATRAMTIKDSTKIGIGTDDPDTDLHIATIPVAQGEDPITIGGATMANGRLLLGTTTVGMAFDENELIVAGDHLHLETLGEHDIKFRTNGTELKMIVRDGGNVGIGIAEPTEKLHVQNGSINVTPIQYSSNQEDYILKYGAHNNAGWDGMGLKMKSDASGVPYISFCTPIDGNEVLTIKGGTVGIGTTATGDGKIYKYVYIYIIYMKN